MMLEQWDPKDILPFDLNVVSEVIDETDAQEQEVVDNAEVDDDTED